MTATPARRSAEEQQRLEATLSEMFERRIPFNQVLGLKVESLAPGAPRLGLQMRPELVGDFSSGRLHGGVISATLDALGGLALMLQIGEKHAHENTAQLLQRCSRIGTIDLRVDYLRQGLGLHFVGSAEVTRLGSRVASTQMRLHNDEGTLVATAAASYIVS